jgi:2-(1,2-epoxy-1,2-dihydrophenyl)acetyl-CoA isomerase
MTAQGAVGGPVLTSTTDDGVLTVTLNRPEVRNALIPQVNNLLTESLESAATDPGVRVVVLAGAGKSFCAGGDARFTNVDFPTGWAPLERSVKAMASFPKPLVVRVQGHAIGFGCTLALLGDFIVAEDDATFLFPFVHMGLVTEGVHMVARLVRPVVARSFVLLGEPLTGAEAAAVGLIYRAVPAGSLDQAVSEIVRKILAIPSFVIERVKAGLTYAGDASMDEMLEWERIAQAELRAMPGSEQHLAAYFRARGVARKPEPPRTQG